MEVTPSNTGCFYYFDLAAKADFDTWGTDAEIVASVVADLKETAAYYQANGYDLDWTDFLSIGPDGYEFTKLSPDTEYVVYAFALTEEGRPLTGVTRETVRTEAFVPTDDCTFGISFRNVSVTAFDISVRPSNAATRYYIGVCSKELFDKNTPSSIADAFIEMENGYEIDWAGNEYIWTGDVTVDTDADLAMGDLDAGTDYVAVVFGVSTEGVRTTEVASAVQRTSELVPSTMTIGLNVHDVTASGAKFDVTPSNTDEVHFADVFVYDEYTAYDEGKEAYAEVYMDILKAYGLFDYSLYSGNRTVDFTDMLEPSTTYVAVAFGYNGGRTTKIFGVGTFHHLRSGFGYGSENRAQPPSRFARRLPSGTPEHRETVVGRRRFSAWHLARFSSVADLRELPSQGLRGEPSDTAGVASAPFLRVRNPKKGLSLAATTPSSMRQGSFRFAAVCGYFSPFEEIDLAPAPPCRTSKRVRRSRAKYTPPCRRRPAGLLRRGYGRASPRRAPGSKKFGVARPLRSQHRAQAGSSASRRA